MLIPAIDQKVALPGVGVLAKPENPAPRLTADAPATALMTDFRRERATVVAPGRHVDAALRDMILDGVRALVVVDDDQTVLGLITASDILGPRPVQFLQNPLCDSNPCRHQDVHVGDIMTVWAHLQLLEFTWLAASTCRDIAVLFAATETSHLLVVEGGGNAPSIVRGLISRTRLMRQLAPS
jgi:CBS domain-containing protein